MQFWFIANRNAIMGMYFIFLVEVDKINPFFFSFFPPISSMHFPIKEAFWF